MTGILFHNLSTPIVDYPVTCLPKTRTNYQDLHNLLNFEFWECVYQEPNASAAYDKFKSILNNHISNCSTTVSGSIVKKFKTLKPWMSVTLLRLVKKKNNISKKCLKHPDNVNLKKYHRKLCDKLKTLIPSLRDNKYLNEFNKYRGNSGGEWKVVNNILNRHQICFNMQINSYS